MKYSLIKWVALFCLTIFVYQNRMRLLNMILGMKILRSLAIRGIFRIPGIREKMAQDMF
ncbi:hypothetical protein [Alkalihalobacillus sp. AL-G]|uniref:hypothetical protein n=1 Tax=Alkalihalobacillus sp. AL-G TaxID=2926399 RepID=UPI00272CBFB2|nr:hypothetical protein [Alkalihalobacillus sp. AL-G]WLD92067.1 hypothetical protein MOJ78_13630 [Alkalihalobacillus sp. AL-G]